MNAIRITASPPGEAPANIRKAWVDVVIPLPTGRAGQRQTIHGWGVLTGPKTFVGGLIALLLGKYEKYDAYTVDALAAVDALARANPDAANWWRENTPHLLKPGRKLVFPADVCETIEE